MNQLIIAHCTIVQFPHTMAILEAHSEVFDYQLKRNIIQTTQKVIDENPRQPTVFTAQHEGSIIGFIGLNRSPDDPALLDLYGQAVKRGYQGQGVGTKMLDYVSQFLIQNKASHIRVKLRSNFPLPTKHFYEHRGFKPYYDESYRGASVEDVVLIKALA